MSGNNPLVSVVISAYNHENYVQETIKSIINQTYQNIELLVFDDGSTDSTWQKIQEMSEECEKRFTRVFFETKQNEGICATLNKLIKEANGKYVYDIASDDMAMPNAIEREVEFLENNPKYSLAVGDCEIIDSEGNKCYWDKKRKLVKEEENAVTKTFVEFLKRHNNYFNDNDFGTYKTIFRGNYIPNGCLINKSVYDKIGEYPCGDYLEDWWAFLQISKYFRMKYIDETLFLYRWHDANTVKKWNIMKKLIRNTLAWEVKSWENVDKKSLQPGVKDTIKNGVIKKTQGFKGVVEVDTLLKEIYKVKIIKIFGKKIFEYKKEL